ncbi:hypothetical protein E2C01_023185 [Portunus trituberculatus]|uniref:Uncharacterized protein n=1 Tax=Portunus trituberculatus TaxID=210409 RepID=A0A5B7E7C0_PORTR|nr:hypothetical protein [Portunus trituberculatus]
MVLYICTTINVPEEGTPEKDYRATLPDEENVVWAWMLFFCFIVPELGTWFRSTRMCVFKKNKPNRDASSGWFWSICNISCPSVPPAARGPRQLPMLPTPLRRLWTNLLSRNGFHERLEGR